MNFKREFTERTNFAVVVVPNLVSFSCSSPQLVVVVPDLVAVVITREEEGVRRERFWSVYFIYLHIPSFTFIYFHIS